MIKPARVAAALLAPWMAMAWPATADIPVGYDEFLRYCSACHGEAADGEGPVANVLKPPPPALTRLHEKYGRPLGAELVAYVLGETRPRAHGTSDMPVWGRNLREAGSRGERAREIIWEIVDYLESIQED